MTRGILSLLHLNLLNISLHSCLLGLCLLLLLLGLCLCLCLLHLRLVLSMEHMIRMLLHRLGMGLIGLSLKVLMLLLGLLLLLLVMLRLRLLRLLLLLLLKYVHMHVIALLRRPQLGHVRLRKWLSSGHSNHTSMWMLLLLRLVAQHMTVLLDLLPLSLLLHGQLLLMDGLGIVGKGHCWMLKHLRTTT